jgi:hypothetical protein
MGKKFTVTESERKRIEGLYEQLTHSSGKSIVVGQFNNVMNSAQQGSIVKYMKEDGTIDYFIWNYINFSKNFAKGQIKFTGEENITNDLYGILKGMCSKIGQTDNFTLGNVDVQVKTIKNLGVVSLQIQLPEGYTMFTEKQLDKLFGK